MARISDDDLKYAISLTLGDHPEDFNIPGIAEALRADHPDMTTLDDVPTEDYWETVRAYDRSEVEEPAEVEE